MIVFLVWIVGSIIFFFILYTVIQSAIDNSKMAQNIGELTEFMREQRSLSISRENIESDEPAENMEPCPACGHSNKEGEPVCRDCGIALKD